MQLATVKITPEIEASIKEADAVIAGMDKARIAELQASVVYSDEEEAAYEAYVAAQKTVSYVIAGTVRKNGKLQRVGGIVDIEDTGDDFSNDMAAMKSLPTECFAHRHGKHVPECWPLESAEGTRLALANGLIQSQKRL